MYAKIFSQIYDSSLAEDWKTRMVFMDLMVLADPVGIVDMTHEAIARRTNVPIEIIRKAIGELCKPDVNSRSDDDEGRRLVLLDEHRNWGWQIVNFEKYRNMRDNNAKREYMRLYMQRRRGKEETCEPPVNTSKQQLADTEPEPEPEAKAESTPEPKEKKTSSKKAIVDAEIKQIFDHWHSDDLVWQDPQTKKHRCKCPQSNLPWKISKELTPDIIDNIKQHLGKWKVDQLITAIENYHQVLTSTECTSWTYRWSISEFFGRHMPNERSQFAFYRFLPNNFDPTRYKRTAK